MNHDVICLTANLKIVDGPVSRNLCRRVDQNVPVWKFKLSLISLPGLRIDDVPAIRRFDRKRGWILFMIDDVHEHAPTVDVSVVQIQLRERA